jgi:quercetin dioxygenase-like cupin family protein
MSKKLVLPLLAPALLWCQTPTLFDTDLVRVLKVSNEPGQKSRLHKHDVNRVMIHLDAGTMRLDFKDSGPKDIKFTPGQVRWDPADGLHTSENVGGTTYRIVEVELKKPKGTPVQFPALDPVKIDSAHYKTEFENDQVRVIRARFDAGYKTPVHEHVLPRVVVYLTDYHMKVLSSTGAASEPKGSAGDVAMPGPAKHEETNVSGQPFEVLVVELKSK